MSTTLIHLNTLQTPKKLLLRNAQVHIMNEAKHELGIGNVQSAL